MKVRNLSENNCVELSIRIPYKGGKRVPETSEQSIKRMAEVISFWKDKIIESLQKRMDKCIQDLQKNLGSVFYNNGTQIVYETNENPHSFNVPSYNTMENAVKALEHREFEAILKDQAMIDQIIKALMISYPGTDLGKVKYSELISVLTWVHMNPVTEY